MMPPVDGRTEERAARHERMLTAQQEGACRRRDSRLTHTLRSGGATAGVRGLDTGRARQHECQRGSDPAEAKPGRNPCLRSSCRTPHITPTPVKAMGVAGARNTAQGPQRAENARWRRRRGRGDRHAPKAAPRSDPTRIA
jgi:hypothetical protein